MATASRSRMPGSPGLEARLSLAVGCTLALTVAAIGLGVLLRVHGEVAAGQHTALDREATIAAAALQAGATTLPAADPQVALFVQGRRLGAALPRPSTAVLAHAG